MYDFETASCQDHYETMEISDGGTLEYFLNNLLTPDEFETLIDKTNGLYEAYQNKTLDYKGVYEALKKICSNYTICSDDKCMTAQTWSRRNKLWYL